MGGKNGGKEGRGVVACDQRRTKDEMEVVDNIEDARDEGGCTSTPNIQLLAHALSKERATEDVEREGEHVDNGQRSKKRGKKESATGNQDSPFTLLSSPKSRQLFLFPSSSSSCCITSLRSSTSRTLP